MATSDIIKDFLSQLEPDDVPFEYIASASIKDVMGHEVMLKGEKLKRLMSNHPDYHHVRDARIFINLQKVSRAIQLEVEYVFEQVNLKFMEQYGKK